MLGAENRFVSVVVEEAELRPPRHHHGKARLQHDAYRGSQTLRPIVHGAKDGAAPVRGAHELAHNSAAGQAIFGLLQLCKLTHNRVLLYRRQYRKPYGKRCAKSFACTIGRDRSSVRLDKITNHGETQAQATVL